MSGSRRPPRTRDRVLGAQLRAVRTQCTALLLEQAAAAAGMSSATLSRIETGRRPITSIDAAILLSTYGAPRPLRDSLVELAGEGCQDGIWQVSETADYGGIAQLEAAAHRMTEWTLAEIPALLQSPSYAAEQLRASGLNDDEVNVQMCRLQERQEALTDRDYSAFIPEAVVMMQRRRHEVWREQTAYLIKAIDRGIGVRVIRSPLSSEQATAYSWSYLEFPADPPIARVQLQTLSLYFDEPESATYDVLRTHLASTACTAKDSQRLLRDLLRRAH
jgi:transcriptional regulator with XRE-family HTH domain